MSNENQQNNQADKNEDKIQADLSGNSFLQTPEEFENDKKEMPKDTISVSKTADRESEADKYAGSDRAGTAERKSQELDTFEDE